jgi:hypothetical protein
MSSLFDKYPPGLLSSGLGTLGGGYTPAVKRKTYFAFHFDDVMRINVVRNAWKITHPDSASMRGFYDSSFWESKQLEGPAPVKRLIREGVDYTSAVCVLVGSETWSRRWVRYEIARAVIDNLGLLAVHLNSIKHHQTLTPHARGPNPLSYMAVGKVREEAWKPIRYFLFERKPAQKFVNGQWMEWQWERYQDYTDPVKLPSWLADPAERWVTPLSNNADEYDYIAQDGHKNIGAWIDRAAQRVGR